MSPVRNMKWCPGHYCNQDPGHHQWNQQLEDIGYNLCIGHLNNPGYDEQGRKEVLQTRW
jgi:hypothetical protein